VVEAAVSQMNSTITIVGYGNQGRPWGENLRDSGWKVTYALRKDGESWKSAKAAGFQTETIEKALPASSLIAILIPDDAIPSFFSAAAPHLPKKGAFIFAHGFAYHYKTVSFPENFDRILVAPKGIGTAVRELYQNGSGVPAVLAVDFDASGNAWQIANQVADGLGAARAGVYKASVREEVEADLFSEQTILCGGVPVLIEETYNILVQNGFSPEAAYLECVHELSFITDRFQKKGIFETLRNVSPTARFGGVLTGQRIASDSLKNELKSIFADIKEGTFKQKLEKESASGFPQTEERMKSLKTSSIEKVGNQVRARLSGKPS